MFEYYYIDVKEKEGLFEPEYPVIIRPEDVPNFKYNGIPGLYEKYVLEVYERYCKNKDYYHCTLRTKDGIFHGLISESWNKTETVFYYDTYPEYKYFFGQINQAAS